jgi:hypothetical protein
VRGMRFVDRTRSLGLMSAPRIPSAFPEGPDGPIEIKVISGKTHGIESPVRPLGKCTTVSLGSTHCSWDTGGCWYFHVIFRRKASVFMDLRQYTSVPFSYMY